MKQIQVLGLLRSPGVRRMLFAGLVAKLPPAMVPLGLVLAARAAGGSFATSGSVAAAFAIGTAVSGPALGRLVDRRGPVPTLNVVGVVGALGLGGLALAVQRPLEVPLCIAVALLTGAAQPPLVAATRARWPEVIDSPQLASAYRLEAIVQELSYIGGPLAVALTTLVVSPRVALVAASVLTALGTAMLTHGLGSKESAEQVGVRALPLAGRALRLMLCSTVLLGVGIGALELAVPALAEAMRERAQAGVVLGCISLGSLLGGLLAPAARPGSWAGKRYAMSVLLFAALVCTLMAGSSLAVTIAFALLTGLPLAPGFAAAYELLRELSPPGALSETFAWFSTAITIGTAAGSVVGGFAVRDGYRAGFAVCACACAIAGVLAAGSRAPRDLAMNQ